MKTGRAGGEPAAGEPAAIRTGTLDDVAAIRSILGAHGNDSAEGERAGPDVVGPYIVHLLLHHRVLVSADGTGTIVAFGAVVDTGLGYHLADLFVRPDRLGAGYGRPLLAELYGDRWPRTTLASEDPRALPSYVRAGMAPRSPALYLEAPAGAARDARRGRVAGFEVVDGDPVELCALEAAWSGADRAADHAFWGSLPGADPMVVHDADGVVALAYARDRQSGPSSRTLDRMLVRPGADPVGPLFAVLDRAAARAATLDLLVLGPHPALRELFELGFRLVDRDTYCAGPTDPVDPARRLPNNGML